MNFQSAQVSKLKGGAQNAACSKLCSANACSYNAPQKVTQYRADNPDVYDVLDIEDLCKRGNKDYVCPYYLSRWDSKFLGLEFEFVMDSKP